MKVKCTHDEAGSFPQKYFDMGNTPQTEFNLAIGKEYNVYGINMWRGVISYLLIGERSETPSWYPDMAFEICDNTIPSQWYMSVFTSGEKNNLQMIVGYDELVNSVDSHYENLIEYEPEALRIFYQRKREIDSLSNIAY